MNYNEGRFFKFLSIVITLTLIIEILPWRLLYADSITHGEHICSPLSIEYDQNSTWGCNTQGQYTITNDSAYNVLSWTIAITYADEVTVTDIWNANNSTSGSSEQITISSNTPIAAGSTYSFGMIVTGSEVAPTAPISISLVDVIIDEPETTPTPTPTEEPTPTSGPTEEATNTPTVTVTPTPSDAQAEVFPFAIFSASTTTDFTFMGWKSYITGDVYSGKDFSYQGSELYMTGYARTVGQVLPAGWATSMSGIEEGIEPISIPQWDNVILDRISDEGGDTDIIYSDSDITIDATTYETTTDPTIIYSSNGNITIIGNEITINGLIYAPDGRITINANNATINGRIVANEVVYNGSILTVNSSSTDLEFIYDEQAISPTPSPTLSPEGVAIVLDTSFCVESEIEGLYYIFDYVDSVSGTLLGYEDVASLSYSISSAYEEDSITGTIDVEQEWSSEDIGFFFGPTKIVFTATTFDNQEVNSTYLFFSWTYSNADKLGIDILSDSDSDFLPNYLECEIGTDPDNEDSDEDGIPDGLEFYITMTDPLNSDTDEDSVLDGDEDDDNDGLSFVEEIDESTLYYSDDTDEDGLIDGDEVNIYHTNPLDPDSDGDEISDFEEVMLGRNPNASDAAPIEQTVDFVIDCEDSPEVTEVSITMTSSHYLPVIVNADSVYNINMPSTDVVGRIGAPVEFESAIDFNNAVISFTYDESVLGDTDENNLIIMWLDEDNNRFIELSSTVDTISNTVSAEVTHFSKYVLVDRIQWDAVWSTPIDYSTSVLSDTESYDFIFVFEDTVYSAGYKDDMLNVYRYFANHLRSGDRIGIAQEASGHCIGYSNLFTNSLDAMEHANYLLENYSAMNTGTETIYATNSALSAVYSIYQAVDQGDNIPIVLMLISNNSLAYSSSYAQRIRDTYGVRCYTINFGQDSVGSTVLPNNHIKLYGGLETELEELMLDTGGYQLRGSSPQVFYEQLMQGADVDGDDDGIPDIYETQGLRSYTGRIVHGNPQKVDSNDDLIDDWDTLGLEQYHRQYSFFKDVYNALPTYNGQHYVEIYYDLNEVDPDGDGLYMNTPRTISDDNGNEIAILPADTDSKNKNAPPGLLNSYYNSRQDDNEVAHTLTHECYTLDLFRDIDVHSPLWSQICTVFTNKVKNDLTNIGSIYLQFYKDDLGIAFHSRYFQLERYFGYANLYDAFLNVGTGSNSRQIKSPVFYDANDNQYVFWAWRGDYLNLGTGGELGFYYIPDDNAIYNLALSSSSSELRMLNAMMTYYMGETQEWWMVAPYELGMELSIYQFYDETDFEPLSIWVPDNNQWWITAFNSNEWDVEVEDTWMIAKIDFNRITSHLHPSDDGVDLFNQFLEQYNELNSRRSSFWFVDETDNSIYLIWGNKYV